MTLRARVRTQSRLTLFFGVCAVLRVCVIALAGDAIARLCSQAIQDQANAEAQSRAAQVMARIERNAGEPLPATPPPRLRAAVHRAVAPGEAKIAIRDSAGRILY